MKRSTKVSLILAAVLLLAGLWYVRPRSFSHTLPGFQKGEPVTSCYATLVPNDTYADISEITLDEPARQELLALLDSTTYLRSPADLFRLGRASDVQTITLDPCPNIYLRQGERLFQFTPYGPHVVVEEVGGASRTYLPRGGEEFQEDVVRFLVDCAKQDGPL